MHNLTRSLVALGLALSLTGCLGTVVDAPTGKGSTYDGTSPHILLSPTSVDAQACPNGLQQVAVYVPLWGVAVGILTLGILVPMNTTYTCAS
jgi:hypothetical protein